MSTTDRAIITTRNRVIQVTRGHQPLVTLQTAIIRDHRSPAQIIHTPVRAIPEIRTAIQDRVILAATIAVIHVQAALAATIAATRVRVVQALRVQAAILLVVLHAAHLLHTLPVHLLQVTVQAAAVADVAKEHI